MGSLDYVREANQTQTNNTKSLQFAANKGRYFGAKEDKEETNEKPKKKPMILVKNKVNKQKAFNKVKNSVKADQVKNNEKSKNEFNKKPFTKAKIPTEVPEENNEKLKNKINKNSNSLKSSKSKFKTNKVMKKIVKN